MDVKNSSKMEINQEKRRDRKDRHYLIRDKRSRVVD
jgi:hypothetical protein